MIEIIKYSVVIPVFNAETSLKACIDSILEQSVKDFEILLVDDGSIDSSPAICDGYAEYDTRIKVFHQPNKGVSEARNKGIEEACGEWISFVDADDTVSPDYLVEFDKVDPKADLTYFGSRFIPEDGLFADYHLPDKFCEGREAIEERVLSLKKNAVNYGHYGYTWNKFFRNSTIQEHHIRFTSGIFFREDEIFVNDFLAHINSLATMSYIGYNYKYTCNGLSWRKKTKEYWDLYSVKAKEFLYSITNERLQEEEYKKVVFACYQALENETDNCLFLEKLNGLLDVVRRFGHLHPLTGGSDYFSSALDYYKDKSAKRRIDTLRMKKRVRIRLHI